MRRLYIAFGCVIPPGLVVFACWGWYLITFEIGVGWILRKCSQRIPAVLYIASTNLLFQRVIRDYVLLCAFPRSGDVPPLMPPDSITSKTSAFECVDHEGNVPYCSKDECKKQWKAPRSHHCSTCGICKLEWDHHSLPVPLGKREFGGVRLLIDDFFEKIGNCVSKAQSWRFFRLLWLTPFTILTAALPVLPIQWRHALAALRASLADEWVLNNWWQWMGSWIIFGGPVGRYVAGLVYGYRILQRATPPNEGVGRWGDIITKPRLSVLGTVLFALLIAGFSLALAIQMAINIGNGETTIDIMKRRYAAKSAQSNSPAHLLTKSIPRSSPLVWIPRRLLEKDVVLPDGFTGRAVPSLSGERLYDHSWRENWRRFLDSPSASSPGDWERFQLNPLMINRMKKDILGSFPVED